MVVGDPGSDGGGLVVVSSDVPGATFEMVEDRRSGRIFPAGQLEQLKQALLDATSEDALPHYKRESAAAFERWRNKTNPVAEIRRALVDVEVLDPLPHFTNELSTSRPSVSH